VALKIRDILKNEKRRIRSLEKLDYLTEEIAPVRAIKAFLLASLGKRLTWKACAEDGVVRDL
jgi:hypothetical protein